MNIRITARHTKASRSLQESIRRDIRKLEKFSDKITSCHVVLDNEYVDKTVEIVANILGGTVSANAKSENVGKALDKALQKIQRQIKKVNKKIKNHKPPKKRVGRKKPAPATDEHEDEMQDVP